VTLFLFVLVVILLAAVQLGFLWWIRRPVQPPQQDFTKKPPQIGINRYRGEPFGDTFFLPIQLPQDRVSELFSFHVKPARPYDWAADRAFSARRPT
jgi:hypothetical protein